MSVKFDSIFRPVPGSRRNGRPLLIVLLFGLALLCQSASSAADEFVFHHENVLGTSLEIRMTAPSREFAQQAETVVLKEIDRLNKILSRYDANSELMQWQQSDAQDATVSADLLRVLRRAEYWRDRTEGAFDVRTGMLTQLWERAETSNQLVSDNERQTIARQLVKAPYRMHNERITRLDRLTISLDGIAKGYVIDAALAQVAKHVPQVSSCCINIGGDLKATGDQSRTVSIVNPFASSVNAKPLATFSVSSGKAVATSGDYARYFEIGQQKLSHIFDPRSGLPVNRIRSATVVAKTSIDADALATSLSVMEPESGLQLIDSLENTECLLVLDNGDLLVSAAFPDALQSSKEKEQQESKKTPAKNAKTEAKKTDGLKVEFTLNRISGRRYRRPYVAVWLEDTDGFPVKTAVLWMQTVQPGPRWHRDLKRWYRNDRMRKLVESKDMIGTISGATRGPGKYSARFDGTDNDGKPLPDGRYTLCVEVAREHGTYQIIRDRFDWSRGKALKSKKLKDNVEVSNVSYSYVPLSEKSSKAETKSNDKK